MAEGHHIGGRDIVFRQRIGVFVIGCPVGGQLAQFARDDLQAADGFSVLIGPAAKVEPSRQGDEIALGQMLGGEARGLPVSWPSGKPARASGKSSLYVLTMAQIFIREPRTDIAIREWLIESDAVIAVEASGVRQADLSSARIEIVATRDGGKGRAIKLVLKGKDAEALIRQLRK